MNNIVDNSITIYDEAGGLGALQGQPVLGHPHLILLGG